MSNIRVPELEKDCPSCDKFGDELLRIVYNSELDDFEKIEEIKEILNVE